MQSFFAKDYSPNWPEKVLLTKKIKNNDIHGTLFLFFYCKRCLN